MSDITKLHFANFFNAFENPQADMIPGELAFNSDYRLVYKDETDVLHLLPSIDDYTNIYDPETILITQTGKDSTIGVGIEGNYSDKVTTTIPHVFNIHATGINERQVLIQYDQNDKIKDILVLPEYLCKLGSYTDVLNVNTGILTEHVQKKRIKDQPEWEDLDNTTIYKLMELDTTEFQTTLDLPRTNESNRDNVDYQGYVYIGSDNCLYLIQELGSRSIQIPFVIFNARSTPVEVRVPTKYFLFAKGDKFSIRTYRWFSNNAVDTFHRFIDEDEPYEITDIVRSTKIDTRRIRTENLDVIDDNKVVDGLDIYAYYDIVVTTDEVMDNPTLSYEILSISEGFFSYMYRILKHVSDNSGGINADATIHGFTPGRKYVFRYKHVAVEDYSTKFTIPEPYFNPVDGDIEFLTYKGKHLDKNTDYTLDMATNEITLNFQLRSGESVSALLFRFVEIGNEASLISGLQGQIEDIKYETFMHVDDVIEEKLGKSKPLQKLNLTHGLQVIESDRATPLYLNGHKIEDEYASIYGKTNINHLPLFDSGYWNLHTGATVADPSKIVVNAGTDMEFSSIDIRLKQNQTYTLSGKHNGSIGVIAGGAYILPLSTDTERVFNTGNNSIITIRIGKTSEQPSGEYIFERFMLNEGDVAEEFVSGIRSTENAYVHVMGDNLLVESPQYMDTGAKFNGPYEIEMGPNYVPGDDVEVDTEHQLDTEQEFDTEDGAETFFSQLFGIDPSQIDVEEEPPITPLSLDGGTDESNGIEIDPDHELDTEKEFDTQDDTQGLFEYMLGVPLSDGDVKYSSIQVSVVGDTTYTISMRTEGSGSRWNISRLKSDRSIGQTVNGTNQEGDDVITFTTNPEDDILYLNMWNESGSESAKFFNWHMVLGDVAPLNFRPVRESWIFIETSLLGRNGIHDILFQSVNGLWRKIRRWQVDSDLIVDSNGITLRSESISDSVEIIDENTGDVYLRVAQLSGSGREFTQSGVGYRTISFNDGYTPSNPKAIYLRENPLVENVKVDGGISLYVGGNHVNIYDGYRKERSQFDPVTKRLTSSISPKRIIDVRKNGTSVPYKLYDVEGQTYPELLGEVDQNIEYEVYYDQVDKYTHSSPMDKVCVAYEDSFVSVLSGNVEDINNLKIATTSVVNDIRSLNESVTALERKSQIIMSETEPEPEDDMWWYQEVSDGDDIGGGDGEYVLLIGNASMDGSTEVWFDDVDNDDPAS